MRLILFVFASMIFTSCDKDDFTTEPQIKFVEFDRNQGSNYESVSDPQAHLIIEVTDADGDIGFSPGKDTARIYIKNLLTNFIDSSKLFPDIGASGKKNFKAEVEIGLFSVMKGRDLPSSQRPYSDTLFFEVYISDFAKNKSNVIVTPEPFIFHTLP